MKNLLDWTKALGVGGGAKSPTTATANPASDSDTVDTKALATILDMTPRRVQQLANEGLPSAGHNQWQVLPAIHWYISFLRSSQPQGTIRQEKYRLERAKADKAEIEVALMRGDQLDKATVMGDNAKILSTLRIKLLGLSGRMASQLANIDQPARIKALINNEVRATLNQVAQGLERFAVEEKDNNENA